MSTWGIAFGDTVLEGDFTLGSHDMNFASGAGIIRFPDDGIVIIPPTLKVRILALNLFRHDMQFKFCEVIIQCVNKSFSGSRIGSYRSRIYFKPRWRQFC